MLSTRYVYLHEALGLGVLWLNAHAKLLPNTLPESIVQSQTPNLPEPKHLAAPSTRAQNARLATLQRIRSTEENATTTSISGSLKTVSDTLPTPKSHTSLSAKIMVISMCASPNDIASGQLLSGADGQLLNKMLASIQLRAQDACCYAWLTDLPDFNPTPDSHTIAAATPRITQQWRDSGAKALLLLGDFFYRHDVRQQLAQFSNDHERFIVPHPARLISHPSLKRGAWQTLQQLQAYLQAA